MTELAAKFSGEMSIVAESRVSLFCIADHVLALRQPPKQRSAGPKQDSRALGIPDPELNDDLHGERDER
jgi:hypothetical protein